jgi:hypothetical protein
LTKIISGENMETSTENQVPTLTLFTVAQFSERHSFITQGGLRFQIFNSKENGLDKSGALVRLGRRVLINERNYFYWIDAQQKVVGNEY